MTLSATELAEGIREGRLSPVEVVDAHIRRIETVNPTLNALVADRFDAAREDARRAEDRLRIGGPELPPLLGVPFTVKEMIHVEGMPITYGSLARAGHVADRDATIVRRLREAGAIPLGVSNTPEWGLWFETSNLVYGRTRNPYDPRRTPGGSSGGEGALIGAGTSPFGLGCDIGGSIRMPAAFCGVFGHKPTPGLLPLTGHYPVYESGPEAGLRKSNPFVVLGPIARSARDLVPLLRIMAGTDGIDPNARALDMAPTENVDWAGRRVLLLDDPRIALAAKATPAARAAVRRVARLLEERGAIVEEFPNTSFRHAVELWFAALHSLGEPPLGEILGAGKPIGIGHELLRGLTRRPRYSLPATLLVILERFGSMAGSRGRAALEKLHTLRAHVIDRLGSGGILLMPPHPRVAPRHGLPFLRPFDYAYTAIVNALRMPATVAPVGCDRHGMPLSVQIVSRPGNDFITIAAARLIEERFGGWRPPAWPSINDTRL